MGEERRKRERFPLAQSVELKTSDGTVINSNGVDISEGGILCRTETEIKPGTSVSFQLTIPIGKREVTVGCSGNILRCTPKEGKFDIGIELTDQEYM
jgi:hypothetical protein